MYVRTAPARADVGDQPSLWSVVEAIDTKSFADTPFGLDSESDQSSLANKLRFLTVCSTFPTPSATSESQNPFFLCSLSVCAQVAVSNFRVGGGGEWFLPFRTVLCVLFG